GYSVPARNAPSTPDAASTRGRPRYIGRWPTPAQRSNWRSRATVRPIGRSRRSTARSVSAGRSVGDAAGAPADADGSRPVDSVRVVGIIPARVVVPLLVALGGDVQGVGGFLLRVEGSEPVDGTAALVSF